ncbi:uncharacterized protein H6S33_011366 [Morchella sextelata]|uniref:uncharacterized protein n=1 Tax=Morchella sextelata TaxID=1174677 RepID=UPI001D055E6E|nr:uncharacterized protein H6S33_011366 [Morchella sextelata]KAH0610939.1 hypothetical protein H6S33_011366 [Morchella sextelata]
MRHLIPTTKEADSREVARLYIDNVWKLHGLPNTIVSDRGIQFVAEFWKSLCNRLEISLKFSTTFHPQTDGQTERINAYDWARLISMAEFATNNHASETTKVSPFYANKGRNRRMTFGPLEHDRTTAEDQANLIAREMNDPSKKFDWKRNGPYSVKRIINPYSYKLELPQSMKIQPLPPPPVEIEGEEEWEVEDVLDSRKRRGRFEYLVRYVGYDEASWQPLSDLEHSHDIVKRFHERYPGKPKPTRR